APSKRGPRFLPGRDSGREGFVVDLVADYRGMIFEVVDDPADHAFSILQKVGIEEIIILTRAVVAGRERRRIAWSVRITERRRRAVVGYKNLRMFFIKPSRDRIRRRAKNGLDSGLVQAVENALHPSAPGGLPDPNHRDASVVQANWKSPSRGSHINSTSL